MVKGIDKIGPFFDLKRPSSRGFNVKRIHRADFSRPANTEVHAVAFELAALRLI